MGRRGRVSSVGVPRPRLQPPLPPDRPKTLVLRDLDVLRWDSLVLPPRRLRQDEGNFFLDCRVISPWNAFSISIVIILVIVLSHSLTPCPIGWIDNPNLSPSHIHPQAHHTFLFSFLFLFYFVL